MVPMPPSRIMIRSDRAFSIRATRSGGSQGRVLIGGLRSGLACEQADYFEMRRAALAAETVAADDIQARGGRHLDPPVARKAEVAMVEGLDDGAVLVLAQCRDEQPSARLEHARYLGEYRFGTLRIGKGVQQEDKIEAVVLELQRMHVASAHI